MCIYIYINMNMYIYMYIHMKRVCIYTYQLFDMIPRIHSEFPTLQLPFDTTISAFTMTWTF